MNPVARKPAHLRVSTNLLNVAPHECPDVAAVEVYLGALMQQCLVWVYRVPPTTVDNPEPQGEQIAHGAPAEAMAQVDAWYAARDAAEAEPEPPSEPPATVPPASAGGAVGLQGSGEVRQHAAYPAPHARRGYGRGTARGTGSGAASL